MKKIFDVETIYKGRTYKEVVHAESAEEAFQFILNKYNEERMATIRERKNP